MNIKIVKGQSLGDSEIVEATEESNSIKLVDVAAIATETPNETKVTPPKCAKRQRKIKAGIKRPSTSAWAMTVSERENAAQLLQSTTLRPFACMPFPVRFKCFYCDEIHPELVSLLNHTSTHVVPSCSDMLSNLLKRGKKRIKVDISELKCKLCDAPFSTVDDARRHLVSEHNQKFNTESGNGMIVYNLKTKNGMFSCHMCKETFYSFFILNRHINVHFHNAICDQCGKGFVTRQRLQQHKEIHLKGKIKCEKCDRYFETSAKFRYHNDRVHNKPHNVYNIYTCQHCSARFDDHYAKMRHLSEKHDVKFEYPCDYCKTVFYSGKALTRHRMKYHLNKSTCELCHMPFSDRSHLRKHMVFHTDKREFSCPLCTKAYKHEKNAKLHMKVHNPAWKFACAECFVGFTFKAEFKKHMSELHANKTAKE